jgi:hypothetical protein
MGRGGESTNPSVVIIRYSVVQLVMNSVLILAVLGGVSGVVIQSHCHLACGLSQGRSTVGGSFRPLS